MIACQSSSVPVMSATPSATASYVSTRILGAVKRALVPSARALLASNRSSDARADLVAALRLARRNGDGAMVLRVDATLLDVASGRGIGRRVRRARAERARVPAERTGAPSDAAGYLRVRHQPGPQSTFPGQKHRRPSRRRFRVVAAIGCGRCTAPQRHKRLADACICDSWRVEALSVDTSLDRSADPFN